MYNIGVEENDGIQKPHHSSPCPCFANRRACLYRVESQIDIDSPARNGSNFPNLQHYQRAFVKSIEIKCRV